MKNYYNKWSHDDVTENAWYENVVIIYWFLLVSSLVFL